MNVLDTFQLKGRRALITGSSAGIGLALAEALRTGRDLRHAEGARLGTHLQRHETEPAREALAAVGQRQAHTLRIRP